MYIIYMCCDIINACAEFEITIYNVGTDCRHFRGLDLLLFGDC